MTTSPVPGQQPETESPGAAPPPPTPRRPPSPLSAPPGPSPAEPKGQSPHLLGLSGISACTGLVGASLPPPSAPWRGILLLTRSKMPPLFGRQRTEGSSVSCLSWAPAFRAAREPLPPHPASLGLLPWGCFPGAYRNTRPWKSPVPFLLWKILICRGGQGWGAGPWGCPSGEAACPLYSYESQ